MTTRMEEIYEFALPSMAAYGIEDTTQNRVDFLTGMYDALREEPSLPVEQIWYTIALYSEITRLRIKLQFPL